MSVRKLGLSLGLSLVASLVFPEPSFSAIYSFSGTDLPGSTGAGKTSQVLTSYQTSADLFTWESTFEQNVEGILPDGAWLVVNGGSNPKGQAGELPIFYLDSTNDTVSVFEYNGANKSDSYRSPGNFLGATSLNTFETADSVTFSFDFDATEINNLDLGLDWQGLNFDDQIGIWFHGVSGLSTDYDKHTQALTYFNYKTQSWYDTAYQDTSKIPEPSLLIGLLAIGAYFGGDAWKKRNR